MNSLEGHASFCLNYYLTFYFNVLAILLFQFLIFKEEVVKNDTSKNSLNSPVKFTSNIKCHFVLFTFTQQSLIVELNYTYFVVASWILDCKVLVQKDS